MYKELRQGAFDGGVVEPQGNEAALLGAMTQKYIELKISCQRHGLSSGGIKDLRYFFFSRTYLPVQKLASHFRLLLLTQGSYFVSYSQC